MEIILELGSSILHNSTIYKHLSYPSHNNLWSSHSQTYDYECKEHDRDHKTTDLHHCTYIVHQLLTYLFVIYILKHFLFLVILWSPSYYIFPRQCSFSKRKLVADMYCSRCYFSVTYTKEDHFITGFNILNTLNFLKCFQE